MSEHPLKCVPCGAEWEVPVKLPAPVDEFTAHLQGIIDKGCPECGAKGPNDIGLRMGKAVAPLVPEEKGSTREGYTPGFVLCERCEGMGELAWDDCSDCNGLGEKVLTSTGPVAVPDDHRVVAKMLLALDAVYRSMHSDGIMADIWPEFEIEMTLVAEAVAEAKGEEVEA